MADISVRETFGHAATSLEGVRATLGVPRPASLRQLAELWIRDIVFDQPIVTSDGVPLGGHHRLTLRHDGSYRYEGHVRATGWPSYDVSILTTVACTIPLPDGRAFGGAQLAFTAHGRVNGTNDFGDREYPWVQEHDLPMLASEWHAFRTATFHRQLEYDADWFGPAGEVVGFIALLLAARATFGLVGVAVVLAAEAAELLDLEQLAIPGIVGIIVAGAAVYVLGPAALIPAFLAGAATTAALVRQRHMTDVEIAFANRVFHGTLPVERILLTNLVGLGERAFVSPGPGGAILVNIGLGYDDPLRYTGYGRENTGGNAPGGLLIHELTHTWQIAREDFTLGYFCRAGGTAAETVGGDMSNYEYGPADMSWESFNSEQQASIVEHWFAGERTGDARSRQRGHGPLHETDVGPGGNPYFRYIRDHIRAGVA
jgi:hypothetical protein